jgi:hypothetical protein
MLLVDPGGSSGHATRLLGCACVLSSVWVFAGCSSASAGGTDGRPDAGASDGSGEGAGETFTLLASGRNLPGAIAIDATYVYWVEGDGTVMRVPKGGGTPNSLASGCKPGALAIDAAHAYCGDSNDEVLSISLASGAVATLATAQPVSDLTVDAYRVYWTTYYGLRPAGNNDVSTVAAVALDGGAPTILAAAQRVPSSLAVDAANCYWLTLIDPATDTGTAVMRAGLDGGAPATVATGSGGSPSIGGSRNKAIAVGATSVYWSDLSGAILRAPLGGGPAIALAQGQDIPGAVAIDADHVYWATVTSIMKVALAGGSPTLLVDGENPGSIVVDEASVYWTNTAKGTIAKAPK